jgi:hypothetical protein
MIDGRTWETLPGVLEANGYSRLEYRSFIGYSREKLINEKDLLLQIQAKEAGKFHHQIDIDFVSNLSV